MDALGAPTGRQHAEADAAATSRQLQVERLLVEEHPAKQPGRRLRFEHVWVTGDVEAQRLARRAEQSQLAHQRYSAAVMPVLPFPGGPAFRQFNMEACAVAEEQDARAALGKGHGLQVYPVAQALQKWGRAGHRSLH